MDFKADAVDSNVIMGLNTLVVSGNLSRGTMLEALVKREIIDIESVDDEIEAIDSEYVEPVEGEADDTVQ